MENKPNNPKAFPSKKFDKYESQRMGGTCYSDHESGMTLRDYFAAKALEAIISSKLYCTGDQWASMYDVAAERAYKFADTMLKQREK